MLLDDIDPLDLDNYDSRPHRVALYGTLREGEANYERVTERLLDLGHVHLEKENVLLPGMALVDMGGLPAMYPSDEENTVEADVYRTSSTAIGLLDLFEGHPTFYRRRSIKCQSIEVPTLGGPRAVGYAYFGPLPSLERSCLPLRSEGADMIQDHDLVGRWSDRHKAKRLFFEIDHYPEAGRDEFDGLRFRKVPNDHRIRPIREA